MSPDFIANEKPKDGDRSVTSLDKQAEPIDGPETPGSTGESLATGDLGVHEMDDTGITAEEFGENPEGLDGDS